MESVHILGFFFFVSLRRPRRCRPPWTALFMSVNEISFSIGPIAQLTDANGR